MAYLHNHYGMWLQVLLLFVVYFCYAQLAGGLVRLNPYSNDPLFILLKPKFKGTEFCRQKVSWDVFNKVSFAAERTTAASYRSVGRRLGLIFRWGKLKK